MSGKLKGFEGLAAIDNLLQTNKYREKKDQAQITHLRHQQLRAGKYQPRTQFNDTTLQELAESIKMNGIIQPLIVRSIDSVSQEYEIIAGERRWRAAALAGLEELPVIIRQVDDGAALGFALIENIQREGLSIVEQARALRQLKTDFALTHEQIAKRVGWPRTTVVNLMGVLELDKHVLDMLEKKHISHGHAKLLFSLDNEMQIKIVNEMIAQQLSVKEADRWIKRLHKADKPQATLEANVEMHALGQKLTKLLNRSVSCTVSGGFIKTTLSFKSVADVETYFSKLRGFNPE